jgi:AcrR family transcriptional regulator
VSDRRRTEAQRRRVARGEGREALYRALVRVVARDGFDGVTFRSVAAEAGVTHGLASYHFATREAMIHEALSWAVGHSIEAAHLAPGDAAGTLADFAADVPRMLSEAPEEAIFQFELLLRALRTPSLRDDVRKSYDEYIAAIGQSLEQFGLAGEPVARLVFAALDGLTLQQLLYDDETRTHEAIDALRQLLLLLAAAKDGGA